MIEHRLAELEGRIDLIERSLKSTTLTLMGVRQFFETLVYLLDEKETVSRQELIDMKEELFGDIEDVIEELQRAMDEVQEQQDKDGESFSGFFGDTIGEA